MPGQIAAVHRGDVQGLERPESPGVIPVDEVSVDAVQGRHGPKRRLESLHHVPDSDPAEIAGDRRAEQIESQVRRRGAVRSDRIGILLEIVERQGVILLIHECLEVAPGAPRDVTQGARLLGRENLGLGDLRGDADAPREQGRQHPEEQERRGHGPDRRIDSGHQQAGGDSQEHAPAQAPVEDPDPQIGAAVRPGRRHPFKEVALRDVEADERADDGIRHQPGPVGQQRQGQERLRHRHEDVVTHGTQVVSL